MRFYDTKFYDTKDDECSKMMSVPTACSLGAVLFSPGCHSLPPAPLILAGRSPGTVTGASQLRPSLSGSDNSTVASDQSVKEWFVPRAEVPAGRDVVMRGALTMLDRSGRCPPHRNTRSTK